MFTWQCSCHSCLVTLGCIFQNLGSSSLHSRFGTLVQHARSSCCTVKKLFHPNLCSRLSTFLLSSSLWVNKPATLPWLDHTSRSYILACMAPPLSDDFQSWTFVNAKDTLIFSSSTLFFIKLPTSVWRLFNRLANLMQLCYPTNFLSRLPPTFKWWRTASLVMHQSSFPLPLWAPLLHSLDVIPSQHCYLKFFAWLLPVEVSLCWSTASTPVAFFRLSKLFFLSEFVFKSSVDLSAFLRIYCLTLSSLFICFSNLLSLRASFSLHSNVVALLPRGRVDLPLHSWNYSSSDGFSSWVFGLLSWLVVSRIFGCLNWLFGWRVLGSLPVCLV